jgi:hypothetical protein
MLRLTKDEVNGGDKIKKRGEKCTFSKSWEHLEPDCPEKKEELIRKRQF